MYEFDSTITQYMICLGNGCNNAATNTHQHVEKDLEDMFLSSFSTFGIYEEDQTGTYSSQQGASNLQACGKNRRSSRNPDIARMEQELQARLAPDHSNSFSNYWSSSSSSDDYLEQVIKNLDQPTFMTFQYDRYYFTIYLVNNDDNITLNFPSGRKVTTHRTTLIYVLQGVAEKKNPTRILAKHKE